MSLSRKRSREEALAHIIEPSHSGTESSEHDGEDAAAGSDNEEASEQLRQLNNATWLSKVIEHLLPRSEPIEPIIDEKQKFLALRKQWAYTGQSRVVNAARNDCTLCGHHHVSTLFTIINIYNNNKTETASHCIKQFSFLNENKIPLSRKESRALIDQDIQSRKAETMARRQARNRFVYR